MIERTGAIDVYFEDEIEVLVEDPEQYSLEELESVLAAKAIEHTGVAFR